MTLSAHIPYGAYWSTPFARWQGSFSELHSLEFAAQVAAAELARRRIDAKQFDLAILGTTVPQKHHFYGVPWLMGLLNADHISGPTVSQACATSVRCLATASREIQTADANSVLVVTADRTSNGPHIYYPSATGMGGTGQHENWVLDNIAIDPYAKVSMVTTAENVASRFGVSLEAQHELVLHRYDQYAQALENDSAFLRRFMTLPFAIPTGKRRSEPKLLHSDEGIHTTSRERLATLKPVVPGGTVTHGSQTHPADGNAGIVVSSRARARELSERPEIDIEVLAFGQARVDQALMPWAPVPAARQALQRAGISFSDLTAVKSHNPFVLNDLVFGIETGFDVLKMNNFGSSLVWGHPQGPTGLRGIIELIEELEIKGGGHGLFLGCAAGDSAMAVVVKVTDQRA